MRYQSYLKGHQISSSLHILSSHSPLFSVDSSPKHCYPCQDKWQEESSLLSPLHYFAQETHWHNTRPGPKSPTTQTDVLAIIPYFLCAFSSGNGASCKPMLHAKKHVDEARRASKYLLRGCIKWIGFVTPHGQIQLFQHKHQNVAIFPYFSRAIYKDQAHC